MIRVVDTKTDFKLLLTGDIEAVSEWILVRKPDQLKSDVVIVPHHGSKSSSNPKFVEAIAPQNWRSHLWQKGISGECLQITWF